MGAALERATRGGARARVTGRAKAEFGAGGGYNLFGERCDTTRPGWYQFTRQEVRQDDWLLSKRDLKPHATLLKHITATSKR